MTVLFTIISPHQGPSYINFDRFALDHTKVEEEFSGWDRDF